MTAVVDLAAQQANALDLVDRGLVVFPADHPQLPACVGRHAPDRPCDGQRGKHPEPWSWAKQSSADEAVVGRAFGRGPRNVGVDCGRSGLLVLDEDTPGEVDRLCADLGVPAPITLMVATGKGAHYYFRQPECEPFGNGVGSLARYSIDVRGRGGYVVGPGSTHASGRRYTIADPAPIAAVPAWLADALRPTPVVRRRAARKAPTRPAVTGVLRVLLDSRQGGRNRALHWCACRLFEKVRDGQLDDTAAAAMLLDGAAVVGLPDGESRATINSARKAVLTAS